MSDLIERQAATDALRKMQTYKLFSGDDMLLIDQAGAMTELMMLPSAQPILDARDTQYNLPMGTDCISRQAAIDELVKMLGYRFQADEEVLDAVVTTINELPSAQPEIIRCKDCKHYQYADNRAFGFPVRRCEWTGFEDVDEDDFCSRAERREVTE